VLLLVVWIAVVVLALVVLGSLLYSLLGAVQRLRREVAAAQRELRPVLEEARGALEAVAARQGDR
jgi:Sec-independent protein translocase protein TatA